VRRLIDDYRNYDHTIEDILLKVNFAESLFELHICELLTDIIGEKHVMLLLKKDGELEDNELGDINIQINAGLGKLGPLIYDAIRQAHTVLEHISEILSHFTIPLPTESQDSHGRTQLSIGLWVARVSIHQFISDDYP
jgi:hypothetical protein